MLFFFISKILWNFVNIASHDKNDDEIQTKSKEQKLNLVSYGWKFGENLS